MTFNMGLKSNNNRGNYILLGKCSWQSNLKLYNNSNRTHHASDFHAQPGGTFSFMGCFMYQYPKQILTIAQQIQTYIDAGMVITSCADVEKALKSVGFYRLRGYSFHLYDNASKKYVPGTKFEDILKLYQFDQELSALFFSMISLLNKCCWEV